MTFVNDATLEDLQTIDPKTFKGTLHEYLYQTRILNDIGSINFSILTNVHRKALHETKQRKLSDLHYLRLAQKLDIDLDDLKALPIEKHDDRG